jgi:hypothetical protein
VVGFEAIGSPTLEIGSRASRVEEAQSEAGSRTGGSVNFGVASGGFILWELGRERCGG